MSKKKKIFLIILGIITIIIVTIFSLYYILLSPVSKSNEPVTITIRNGDSKNEIVSNLKSANLINSKYATFIYIILHGNKNIQAGTYEFSRDMSTKEIIESLNYGDIIKVKKDSVQITFKEGITLRNYLDLVAKNTNLEYDKIIKEINDNAFLKGLIDKYWFLNDDILNEDIYYALEGYLYPNTYEFHKDTTLTQVITKMLDETSKKLEPLKEEIANSNLSIHELLTIASIAEKEANNYEDRRSVSQVVFKRLELNMSLGMDVTAYYGVNKELSENNITKEELNDSNPYNTRLTSFLGLPIGPICNPSIESIKSVLEPSDTDYIYFFADIKTGKVHFPNSQDEFEKFKKIYGMDR